MTDLGTIARDTPLPMPPAGWFDYAYSILSDGRLAILRADRDIHAEYARWWQKSQLSKIFTKEPAFWGGSFSLLVFDGEAETPSIVVPAVRYPAVTRLRDGKWLIVASRALDGEANARLFDPDGALISNFSMGDGIEEIQCATDGSIWVGYFDEGIFGGQSENGAWPISNGGLVQFTAAGKPIWSFNGEDRNGQYIDDCYAFSINGDAVWACYYSGFPIVKIQHGKVKTWTNEIGGAKAIAVAGDIVLLGGGYGDEFQRITVAKLNQNNSEKIGELRSARIKKGGASLLQGHNSHLHMVSDGIWTKVSVQAAYEALTQRVS